MEMDPVARRIGEALTGTLDISKLDLVAARAAADAQARQGPRPAISESRDLRIPGPAGEVLLRVYRPEGRSPLPIVLYCHGGGWTLCSVETHDAICRSLANGAGSVVVSVDYRLAPEHGYPAAVEDSYAALCWAAANAGRIGGDAGRMAVAGDSAGGNLAAVLALLARDRGGPALRHQLLVYPITDFAFDTDSYRENAAGPLLTRAMMEAFWGFYLGDSAEGRDPYASPLRAPSLEGLPPAFVMTAEYDPLRDEGEAYARRLREAGVRVESRRYEGMIHGFLAMTDLLPRAREAVADAAGALRAALV